MRLTVVLLGVGLLAACASKPRTGPAAAVAPPPPVMGVAVPAPLPPGTNRNLIVTPGRTTTGRVASVNAAGRFVVLTFPLGTMPGQDHRLNVYRGGLKVGEVKVTG